MTQRTLELEKIIINMEEVKKKNKELVECPRCHGYGWVNVYSLLVENPCPLCKEKGKVTQKEY